MDCSFESGWCISTTGINHPEKNRDNAFQDAFEDTLAEAFDDALMDAFGDTFQDSCEEGFDDAFEDPFEEAFEEPFEDVRDNACDDDRGDAPDDDFDGDPRKLVSKAQAIETFETCETSSIAFTMRKSLNSSMFPRFAHFVGSLLLVWLGLWALALTIKATSGGTGFGAGRAWELFSGQRR